MTVKVVRPAINVREEVHDLKIPTGVAGGAMLKADTVHQQADMLGSTPYNIIINGAMAVYQRGSSFSSSAGTTGFAADRFKLGEHSDAVCTISQQADGPTTNDGQFKYYAQVNVDTADTSVAGTQYASINYGIEGSDLDLVDYGTVNARPMTLSFWHCHSVAGIYSVSIRNSGGGSNRNYLFDYEQTVPNIWQKTCYVFEGDTGGNWTKTNTLGMSIMWTFCNGTTYQLADQHLNKWYAGTYYHSSQHANNTLIATQNAKFRLTGVQLVAGRYPEGLPFEHRSFGSELALCQRYFQNVENGQLSGARNTSTRLRLSAPLHPEMRTRPTISRVTGTTVTMQDDGASLTSTSTAVAQGTTAGTKCLAFDLDGFTGAANRTYMGAAAHVGTAVFIADAET